MASLKQRFRNPPNEFRMMPFWFWNHEMVEREVCRQIEDHYEHGIGGEFVHPRHGRLTPYMSRRWLEVVEAAADKCAELRMPCYLYDEDNWPSGPAGGFITGPRRPENRGKFLAIFDEEEFPPGEHVEYELDFEEVAGEGTFYAALAVPSPERYPDFSDVGDRVVDVSDRVAGTTFSWDAPEGDRPWTVVFFCVLINHYAAGLNGYIDVLRRETVAEFVEFTHKRYVEWFESRGKGRYLGRVVPGIFTDEPSMAHMQAAAGPVLRWVTFTPELPRKFEETFGYPFNEALLSLFYDTGPQSAKHRCHYWTCATRMYVNAFFRQIYEYCDAHGLATTGHVNAEGTFPSHVRNQGDFFEVFRWMHYGGCDQLTEEVRPDYYERIHDLEVNPYVGMANEMVVASKLASSVAHLLGKPRVLVEAYGTSSWDVTLASCKRISDFLVATGCDLFVPHDFAYSEDGYRKQDHPASFPHQPYYVHWKLLADHVARLCTVFNASSGVLLADFLFLYPARGFYAEMVPHDSDVATFMGQMFNHLADCLFRQQVDFEFASKQIVETARPAGDGRLVLGEKEFRGILLGATTCCTRTFAKFVREYFEGGGKVLAAGLLPFKEPDEGESDEVAEAFAAVFGLDPREVYERVKSGEKFPVKLHVNQSAAGGVAAFVEVARAPPCTQSFYPAFEKATRRLLPLEQRTCAAYVGGAEPPAGGPAHAQYVMACCKQIGHDWFVFLANTSKEADYRDVAVVVGAAADSLEYWDTLTGEVSRVDDYLPASGDAGVRLSLEFPPHASYLFRLVNARAVPAVVPPIAGEPSPGVDRNSGGGEGTVLEFGDEWEAEILGFNVAMLHQDWRSSYHVEAGAAWGYQSVRTFSHKFRVEDLERVGPVRLVIEGLAGSYAWAKSTTDVPVGGDMAHFTIPPNLSFKVNGRTFRPTFDFTPKFLDPAWIVHDVTDLLVEGENEVTMTCTTRNHATFHVVTDPWRLVGKFEAEEGEGGVVLRPAQRKVRLGDLASQGFARVHGGFRYSQDLRVPVGLKGKRFVLHITGTTDCVEVHVNGDAVGVAWYSWDVDVTGHVRPGQVNRFELVYYGIAQNLMQTNLKPQGLRGRVFLEAR
ncbi:MAG: hypothetical protein Kow0069_24480 [Promethearchaeota archaeon]